MTPTERNTYLEKHPSDLMNLWHAAAVVHRIALGSIRSHIGGHPDPSPTTLHPKILHVITGIKWGSCAMPGEDSIRDPNFVWNLAEFLYDHKLAIKPAPLASKRQRQSLVKSKKAPKPKRFSVIDDSGERVPFTRELALEARTNTSKWISCVEEGRALAVDVLRNNVSNFTMYIYLI